MKDLENKINSYVNLYEELSEICEEALLKIHGVLPINGIEFLTLTEIDNQYAYFSGEETWRYGGYESYDYELPIEKLLNLDEYIEELKARRILDQKLKEEKEFKRLQEQKQKDLKELQRLKEKYE